VTTPNKSQSGEPPEWNESDNTALVSFLRAHLPPVPEPGQNLESQLMQAIAQEPLDAIAAPRPARPRYRWNGAVVAWIGLGVGAIALGLGQVRHWVAPPGLSSAELVQLESFMVDNWDETIRPSDPSQDGEWLDSNRVSIFPTVASAQGTYTSFSDHSSQP
jgi:hypothetical protein